MSIKRCINNKRGMNSIELLSVMVIVSILSAASIIGVSTVIHSFQMKNTITEITSAMNRARFLAISKHKRYGIFFNSTSLPPSYTVFEDINKNYTFDPKDLIDTHKKKLPTGYSLTVSFNKPDNNVVLFRRNGTAKGGSVCIKGLSKRKQKIIVAIITGRIRIKKSC